MSMNVSAMSGIASGMMIDSEHQRIMRELRAMGIEPTGDKSTDKAKLEAAKQTKQAQYNQIQFVSETEKTDKAPAQSSQDNIKNDTSIQAQNMTGATQIAELNKYKILGLFS